MSLQDTMQMEMLQRQMKRLNETSEKEIQLLVDIKQLLEKK
ncbi:MAG: hypothetical protein AABW72_05590 [archaeon]